MSAPEAHEKGWTTGGGREILGAVDFEKLIFKLNIFWKSDKDASRLGSVVSGPVKNNKMSFANAAVLYVLYAFSCILSALVAALVRMLLRISSRDNTYSRGVWGQP